MKILHILHRSLPGSSGYAIRSKHIVEGQKQAGMEPVVITAPFQSASSAAANNPEYINNIPYYRTGLLPRVSTTQVSSSSIWMSALKTPLVFLFARQVLNLARRVQPQIIHAHSPFYCGLIGSLVARRLGVPCLYEVRGIWEDSLTPANGGGATLPQKTLTFFENRAMRSADSIAVISKHLEEEIRSRGIDKNIFVVPNGVDTNRFCKKNKRASLVKELHLQDHFVLGYIGTLSADYEGLDYLIKALPYIITRHPDALLLLVGDGRLKQALETLSREIGVGENVRFAGRIPHEHVSEYYSLIDIAVYPRKNTQATDLVTALKPLEAMAFELPVLVSNVGGFKEFVFDGKTGILFQAEDIEDLANKCNDLIEDCQKQALLGRQAREWVVENRDWISIIAEYKKVYESLCGRSPVKVGRHRIQGSGVGDPR